MATVNEADKVGNGVGNVPNTGTPTGDSGSVVVTQPLVQNGGDTKPAISFATEEDFQSKINEVLKVRLEREQKKGVEAAEAARRKAEEEAAAKNGEWQKLAEQRESAIAEMGKKLSDFETMQGQVERYNSALKKNLETARTGLPKHILTLLDKMDPVDQLEYLATNADALKTRPEAVPPTPTPVGVEDSAEQRKKAADKAANYYRSSF